MPACSSEPTPTGSRGSTGAAGSGVPGLVGGAAGSGSGSTPIGGGTAGSPSTSGGLITPPTTPTTPANGGTTTRPGVCEIARLNASQVIPDMMIVLDRSGSMEQAGRWQPSVSAVRNVVTALGTQINFGLALFPDPAAQQQQTQVNDLFDCLNAPDPDACIDMLDGSACAPGKIVVPNGENQSAAIGKVLDMTRASGGTPTSDTLQAIVTGYASMMAGPDEMSRPKYVLLVTDGAPTCPMGQGSETLQPDIDAANAGVEALTKLGVKTYVVGYDTTGPGNEMLASVLDGFAQRGGTGDQMHRPVEDENSLLSELQSITSAVASCSFSLDTAPPRADYVLVKLDGAQINLNEPDGWQLSGDRTIELMGQSCATLKSGGVHGVEAEVQCDVVTPN